VSTHDGLPESVGHQPITVNAVYPASPVAPAMPVRVNVDGLRGSLTRPATPPPAEAPDALTLLKALKRRWLLALSLGIVCAGGAAAAAWFLLAPMFTAAALVYVKANEDPVVPPERQPGRGDFSTFLRLQAARIKNREVLLAALKEKEVQRLEMVKQQGDPLLWLENELKVEFQEGSELIKVSMLGSEPVEQVALVKAVTDAYLNITKEVEEKARAARYQELKKLQDDAKTSLRSKREELRTQMNGPATVVVPPVSDGDEKDPAAPSSIRDLLIGNSPAAVRKEIIMTALAKVNERSTQVKADLGRAEKLLEAHKKRGEKLEEAAVPEEVWKDAVEADAQVKHLDARREFWKERIDRNVRSGMRATEGVMIDMRKELAAVESKLKVRRDELRAEHEERHRKKVRTEHAQNLERLQADVDFLADQEKVLGKELLQLAKKARETGTVSTVVDTLMAEIAQEESALGRVGSELKTLEFNLRSPPRISLYQEAGIQKKDIKRQVLATVMAPLMALGLVGIGIGWWEFRARRIHSTDEVVKGLGLNVVGSMPELPNHSPVRFLATGGEEDPSEHQFLESIDGIRTVLLRESSVSETRVIMVTSARGGEGKTTLAGHLACSLARAGRKTLLIDCDLRRPAAHQMFEQALQPGLSEVLLKEVDLAAAVRPTTAVEGLWLLPAGQWDREVVQALAQNGTAQLFAELRKEFDFIVVDSSPVLAAADSLVVGQHADAVILSLLRDVSQVPPVQAAAQKLTSLGIRVLGAVVNGLNPNLLYGSGYGYSRGERQPALTEQA
jgi:capsular exopolysaccharide synthesis family protein